MPIQRLCSEKRLGSKEFIAGWSSPVARQPHKLKVVGSNPTPASKRGQVPERLMARSAKPLIRGFESRPDLQKKEVLKYG